MEVPLRLARGRTAVSMDRVDERWQAMCRQRGGTAVLGPAGCGAAGLFSDPPVAFRWTHVNSANVTVRAVRHGRLGRVLFTKR